MRWQIVRRIHDPVRPDPRPGRVQGRRGRLSADQLGSTTTRSTPSATCSTPSQNPEGYAATDLIAAAGQLQARPLIIHGLNDTNVHLQNSINFIQELEHLDKPFYFLPLPNLNHSYKGDGLVAALSASVDYFVRMLGNPRIRISFLDVSHLHP